MDGGGPRKIGDLLGSIVAKYGYGQTAADAELDEAWRAIADEETRRHASLGAFRRGVLEILVDSSPLLSRLEGFEKESMLREFQARVKHRKIDKIKFRRA